MNERIIACTLCYTIQSQIEIETNHIKKFEEEFDLIDKQCSKLIADVARFEGDIITNKQTDKTLESDTEVFVKQLVMLTELNMDLTKCKLELVEAKIKRQDFEQKLKQCRKDFQRAKNLLVSLNYIYTTIHCTLLFVP